MKVYHGGHVKIETIDLSLCQPQRDFGQGFYVTNIRKHAHVWAKRKGNRKKTAGIVTEFEYIESAYAKRICKIKHFTSYSEEWLDFILTNRKHLLETPAHDFDIVEGPVANDQVVTRIDDYLKSNISKQQLLDELQYHEKTHQICFCTVASFQLLVPVDDFAASFSFKLKHICEPIIENFVKEHSLSKTDAADKLYNSKTFAQLADKTTGFYEKDRMEIYKLLLTELELQP